MRFKLGKRKGAMLGLAVLLVLVACAVFAPWLSPHNPIAQNLGDRLLSPGVSHWFGTDQLGRDVFSRIVYGSRISLLVGVAAVCLALAVGIVIGLLAGFYGGWIDQGLMGVMEVLMAFPSILLAIAVVAILGPNLRDATLAIGIVSIPLYARLTRAQVLSIKEREYVQAAKAIGCPDRRILFAHILPNCLGALIIQVTLGVGGAILDLAGLSFLGLGAQPPTPEWGSMLADTVIFLEKAPWTVIFPGLMITITVLAFNLVGDGLRDWLDPRTQTG